MIYTPWGNADSVKPILNGVVSVSTPSHGGLRVTHKAFNDLAMDKSYLDKVAIKDSKYYWFEDDYAPNDRKWAKRQHKVRHKPDVQYKFL